MSGGEAQNKKKIAIIGVSALILVAMVVAVTVGVTVSRHKGKSGGEQTSTSTKAIQSICQPTDYKKTCEDNLSRVASNVTDPKELVKAGFQVAMDQLREVIKNSTTLKELAKDPSVNQALQNCKELMEYAIDDLSDSFDKLGPFDFTKVDDYVLDLKVWLSAAMTYEQTCLDGFQNTTGDAGEKMRQFLKTSQELTSNGLAMVSEASTLFKAPNIKTGRRLLQAPAPTATDEESYQMAKIIPAWIDQRRLNLATATALTLKPDVVVSKKGDGKYKTINEALKDIPNNNEVKVFVIYVKEGVYDEHVLVEKHMTNVLLIGDGPTKTVITGKKNAAQGTETFQTATVAVVGDYFIAKDIGFENTAGAVGHQAVALRVQSDLSIFYNCKMDGYQDTLYTQTHRQFYRDCTISGTIDFIFGDAAAVFQNCKMIIRKPMESQACMVTAHGRLDERSPSALILQNCTISGEPGYDNKLNKAYLGRPWKSLARVIIMQSQIDDVITPEGWMEWANTTYHNTCWFGEFGNRGAGAELSKRVTWSGIKKVSPEQAAGFTASKFILGDRWILPSGVPYAAGMMTGV